MTHPPVNPVIAPCRCVVLVGTRPDAETFGKGLVDQGWAYRSVGFTLHGGMNNDHALASHLRGLADALDAMEVPDPDLI